MKKPIKIAIGTLAISGLLIFHETSNFSSSIISKTNIVQAFSNQVHIFVEGERQNYHVPPFIQNGTTFIPIRGVAESLGAQVNWNDSSRTVAIRSGQTNISFVVGATSAQVDGKVIPIQPAHIVNGSTMVPLRFVSEALGYNVQWMDASRSVVIGDTMPTTLEVTQSVQSESMTLYTVQAGDTLSLIAKKYGTTVSRIQQLNGFTTDIIRVGQLLKIPMSSDNSVQGNSSEVKVSIKNHTIVSGDNMWNLSQQYGIPMNELLQLNNMTRNSRLSIGQTILIPVYDVPVKETPGPEFGEYLDWWKEARYVYSTGKVATVTDFNTGRTFQVKHTMGGNHADSEPLTARDAQIMREIWGGSYSWTPRAVIVEVDGRRLAAAMHSFPHGDHVIRNNNYPGHFCIHFLNSTRHNDGKIQDSMQSQVKRAAGLN